MRPVLAFLLLCLHCLSGAGRAEDARPSSFVAFESGQVRPLALSADGNMLFAVNTPDNRLEIFDIDGSALRFRFSIPVGMEPVAVAELNSTQVWVVNHLSDSVSIVSLEDGVHPRVIRTLLVGDEPRDIVFAGVSRRRAFITCAHRGQNNPRNPELTQQGAGRADVWVFDPANPGDAPGGSPDTVATLFGDTPRALAVNIAGDTVYAAVFHSGNRTTVVNNLNLFPVNKAEPTTSPSGEEQPETALIVQYLNDEWIDPATGKKYTSQVFFKLPDYDVFAIDADEPLTKPVTTYSGVGTTLFNMAVNPVTSDLYVSNTEALNHIRFEGSGSRGTTLRGHYLENRITVIRDGRVEPQDLNSHLDGELCDGKPDLSLSIADPQAMAVSDDGSTLYLAAFGSRKIVRIDTQTLAAGSYMPRPDDQLPLSAGGPSGVVYDRSRNQLYVFTRFDNGISVVDLDTFRENGHITIYNPEPTSITKGRPFLYDASLSSGCGDLSCAGCHVFGDVDGLAWDLGNPDEEVQENSTSYAEVTYQLPEQRRLHPLKGPMVTQSLRGIADSGPLHWRGDRQGLARREGETTESAAFKEFNGAFVSLLGRPDPLTEEQMQMFAGFALRLTYPPNPIRALDNSLDILQTEGMRIFYEDRTTTPVISNLGPFMNMCVQCHELDPAEGKYGTGGTMAGIKSSQDFKVPHLRNLYQKVGMFGVDSVLNGLPLYLPQIRGFGFDHDGIQDTLFTHFMFGFNLRGGYRFAREIGMAVKDIKAKALISFLMAFDSNLAPIVGQQITLTPEGGSAASERIALFIQRARVDTPRPECDLVVKGMLNGEYRGWVMTEDSDSISLTAFQSDRAGEEHTYEQLCRIASEPGQELTFTCVPPGAGMRMGIDRDEDGVYDADETD